MNPRNRPTDLFAPGLLQRLAERPRKVAVIRASRIGDFICATPAFRALRAELPGAEITLIGLDFVRELVVRSPHLDRFVQFPGYPGIAEQLFEPTRTLEFFEATQGEEFDLAIQMHGTGVYANPFTLMLGARITAGMISDREWPSILDAAFPEPDGGHEIDRWLALAEFLGAPSLGRETEFPLWPSDSPGDVLATAEPPFIGVHAGTRDSAKRWPAIRFADAARALQHEVGGTIVLIGGDEERLAAQEIRGRLGGGFVDLVGRTTLPQAGGIIARLGILLTNDSAPAHIGYALGTPTVTVFGATDPARWGPPRLPRHQVVAAGMTGSNTRGVGVDSIEVARVVDAARQALAGAQSGVAVP